MPTTEDRLAGLESRLERLHTENIELRVLVAGLTERLAASATTPAATAGPVSNAVAPWPGDPGNGERAGQTPADAPGPAGRRPISRRGMIAAAAGAAGAMVLADGSVPAAALGGNLVMETQNTCTWDTKLTANNAGIALAVSNVASSSTAVGMEGRSSYIGVRGAATAGFGTAFGLWASSASTAGYGAMGYATATTGSNFGVAGRSDSPTGYGVWGYVPQGGTGVWGYVPQGGIGVFGQAAGTGVRAESFSTTGTGYGLYGKSASSSGFGVYGIGSATTGVAVGVHGRSDSPSGIGVWGYTPAGATAVYGQSTGGMGVHGATTNANSFGVYSEGRFKATGRSFLAAPNTAPADGDLSNGSISVYLAEGSNQLKIRVRYANGTLKTATVSLA